ncbi:MAG: helix-turn-helix domain-containing protein, partial [Candidatus Atribacteria bacterium]|nr:helix-turn-helix domain-containing protein [Candidatus Atribacteria bacterium]
MPKPNSNNQSKLFREGKDGYLIIPNYFLREWVKVLGIGPALLYLQLLSYCHKEKDIAWPTLTTLSSKLGISKNSLLSYRKILLKYGLIKKIVKRRNIRGNYQSNFYKVTPIESAKNELRQVQNLGEGGAKIAPGVVQNLHPNNNNLNNNNITTTKEGKDAVVAVNFKKLKEKGEEKMLAISEQLRDLDFEESFIEKLLKDYSPKKIEEKIDLLLIKRNIQNPAGWLIAALKNDYQDPEQERYDEEPAEG